VSSPSEHNKVTVIAFAGATTRPRAARGDWNGCPDHLTCRPESHTSLSDKACRVHRRTRGSFRPPEPDAKCRV